MTEPIKLPPLPDIPAAICPWNHSEGVVKNLLEAYATAAIEADRQARGEPVAWTTPDGREPISDAVKESRLDLYEKNYTVPLYTAPQPQQIPEGYKPNVPEPLKYGGRWKDHYVTGWNDCRAAMLEAAPEVKE